MQQGIARVRAFWSASLLNKLVLVTLVGVVCCCPLALAGGGDTPSTATAPTAAPADEPTAEPTTAPEPTDVPPSPAPAPTEEPTPEPSENELTTEERAYFEALAPQIDILSRALGGIGESFAAPDLTDGDWRVRVAAALAFMADSHRRIDELNPPERLVDFHERLTGGTQQCADAAPLVAGALDNSNAEQLNAGAVLVQSCVQVLEELTPELEAIFSGS